MFNSKLLASITILLLSLIQQITGLTNLFESIPLSTCSPSGSTQNLKSPWYFVATNSLIHTTDATKKSTNLFEHISRSNECFFDIQGKCIVYETTTEIAAGKYVLLFDYMDSEYGGFKTEISTLLQQVFKLPQKTQITQQSISLKLGDSGTSQIKFQLTSSTKIKFSICDNNDKDYTYLGKFKLYKSLEDQLVDGCLAYSNLDYTCNTCLIGRYLDLETNTCPLSSTITLNCQTVILINQKYVCIACNLGFILTQNNTCLEKIALCSVYWANSTCKTCIQDYVWNGNSCVLELPNCLFYADNGDCTQCSLGFLLSKGSCDIKIPICAVGEFYDEVGNCLKGHINFCQDYTSPFGNCAKCQNGYRIRSDGMCQLICPSDTDLIKYFVRNNRCIKTDALCIIASDDGYCSLCAESYYAFHGKCYKITQFTTLNLRSNDPSEDDALVKEKQSIYLARPDGSRIYISGPWKRKQVWIDEKEWLYERLPGNSRQYLSGPFAGYKFLKDSWGRWFYVNDDGKIIYSK